jgi:hypothetical protein
LVVHEWPSMRIWMRCTRDILCSQPEHLISRQIRARTVRDEPANPTFSLTGVRVLAENFSGLRDGEQGPASRLAF